MKTDGKNVKWKSKEQREKENRRIRWIFLILFLLVLLGFGGMGYRVWKQYSKDLMQNQYDQLSNSSKILSESLETSMKEYEWDYEMLHNIEVMMQDEAGNYKIVIPFPIRVGCADEAYTGAGRTGEEDSGSIYARAFSR